MRDSGLGLTYMSATGTYNYALAKWLDEKLKPLSINDHTISDVFQFAEEIHGLDLNEDDILVSYDVSALFTNVPLEETIQILANKAFTRNWSMRHTTLTSPRMTLLSFYEWLQNISCFNSTAVFMNKLME